MIHSKMNPPASEDLSKRCPYLGLSDDSDTILGFSSRWNYCHKAEPVAIPKIDYQRNTCLVSEHSNCPVFLAEGKKSLAKDLRMPNPRQRTKMIKRWASVGLFSLFLIVGGLILTGTWEPVWLNEIKLPEEEPTSTIVFIQTDLPPEETVFPPTPTSTKETPTQVEEPFLPLGAYPLDTPIGKTQQLIVHQVEYGESMTRLAANHQTTIEAIDAVNYFLPSPLWAEMVIVIPLKTTDLEGLISFKPVFVDKDNISLEELAKSLAVPSSELIEYNLQDSSCRDFHGWVLVPTEKK